MKKLITIFIVAIVLIVGICVAVSMIIANQPENIVGSGVTTLVNDLVERQELNALIEATDGGSISVNIENNGVIPNIPEDLAIGGKLYFSDDAVYAQKFFVGVGDSTIEADAYLGKDAVYVKNDDILGGAWGIQRGGMKKSFEKSMFYHDSGSEYALDEEACRVISVVLDVYDDEQDVEMIKDITKLSERYQKAIWDIICEHAEFETENDEERIGGEYVNCRVVTMVIDERAQEKIVTDIMKYWEKDKEIPKLLKKYSKTINALADDEDFDVVDEYEDLVEKTMDDFDDSIDNMKFDGELKVVMFTPKMTSNILKLEVSYDGEDLFALDLGSKGLAKSEKMSVTVNGKVTYTYEIKENTKTEYEAKLTVDTGSSKSKTTLATIKVDLEDEKFSIDVAEMVTLKGTFENKKDKVTIELNKIQVTDGETYEPKITIVMEDKDAMPKTAKDIKPIFDMEEENLTEWMEKAKDNEFIAMIIGMSDVPPLDEDNDPGADVSEDSVSGRFRSASTGMTYTFYYDGDFELSDNDAGYYSGTYSIMGDIIVLSFHNNNDKSGIYSFNYSQSKLTIDGVDYYRIIE